ncbi:hypothetical protein PsYK624_085800 [Phanerochaete sordida]|uniref:Uncharacterized protein n=1 Tax=Phanerochaete sordida TaxID=48140 RepID=A0A9P3LEE0_9APHY|nr:hypothetical protein PsYK624_085800 [Phanerochaete sordida]
MAALAPAAPASASNGTDAADALFTPYLTLVLPNTTTVSALAPQRTSARPAASAPPVSASDEDAYLHAHGGGATSGAGGAGALGRHIDFERLKFRLVFIIWPALVGITMAM